MVRRVADRIVVMYRGQVVEEGATQAVFEPPYHPYTEALLSAISGETPPDLPTPTLDHTLALGGLRIRGPVSRHRLGGPLCDRRATRGRVSRRVIVSAAI